MENVRRIRIGIVGYGNLGRGAELAIGQNPDLQLAGIFTRREPASLKTKARVYPYTDLEKYQGEIDVLILCGGSAKDLPAQTPELNKWFNTVDSFDTHAKIPEYFTAVDVVARQAGTLSLISTGWDPGLFSLVRLLGESILPQGKTYTFWGKGVSQGHSNAIRKIEGVKDAVQYTVPDEESLENARGGGQPGLSSGQMHKRICYVVAETGSDKAAIEKSIKTMPYYFKPYDTEVHFMSEEELKKNHGHMQHGGIVMRSGITGTDTNEHLEFSLRLGSNPEFTASVLVACARAVAKMNRSGQRGAISILDIPLGYLSPHNPEELRKRLL